jgi:SRSO17 transposase
MDTERNYANIGRQRGTSGQNVQHFMSNSPWSAQGVIRQVQQEITAKPGLERGGMLILDESAEEKASGKSAGAARQYNGRLGKIEMSQVGTFLAYVNGPVWTWVDGELFLPKEWFSPEKAADRGKLGIPAERPFRTKVQLGWEMIQRALANGLPFEAVACDDHYGRAGWFRRAMDRAGVLYMADVPETTEVYLTEPRLAVPATEPGHKGRPFSRERVVAEEQPLTVAAVGRREDTLWQEVRVRATERGELVDPFAARRVWTIRDGEVAQEWLVIRRERGGKLNYSLSNAPADATVDRLAWWKCQRYFVERTNQDSKSEIGWDELQAQKYRAWEHHLALTILATWYIAETKLDWARLFPRDPALAEQFETEVLPALSAANVRAMLRAAMPLPELTVEAAASLVVEHLVNRTRARNSRIKGRQHPDTS